jgi:Tir chaperone family protein CesT
MLNREDIEGFLDRLNAEGASYKEVGPGIWVVKPGGALDFNVVVHFSPPVVVLRVKVMELPKDSAALAQLSRRLLEMNASDMLHGSYGIEENAVVITEALELSHLDYEEFQAVYESIAIALASHLREIGSLGTSGTHRAVKLDGQKRVQKVSAGQKVGTGKKGPNKTASKKSAATARRSGRTGRGGR